MYEPGKVGAMAYDWLDDQWKSSLIDDNLEIIIDGKLVYEDRAKSLMVHYTDVTGIKDGLPGMGNEIIKCYPNPATNQINIDINPEWNTEACLIELFNQSGQRVKALEVSNNSKPLTASINVIGLPAGMYVLKVSSGKETYTRKVIIE